MLFCFPVINLYGLSLFRSTFPFFSTENTKESPVFWWFKGKRVEKESIACNKLNTVISSLIIEEKFKELLLHKMKINKIWNDYLVTNVTMTTLD